MALEFNVLFRVHVGIAEEDNKILYEYEAKGSVLTGSLANSRLVCTFTI